MIFSPVVVLEAVEAGESGPAVVAHVVPGAGDLGAAPLPALPPLSFIVVVVVVAALKVGVPLEVLQVFAPASVNEGNIFFFVLNNQRYQESWSLAMFGVLFS